MFYKQDNSKSIVFVPVLFMPMSPLANDRCAKASRTRDSIALPKARLRELGCFWREA